MESKKVTLVVVFAALTIVLNSHIPGLVIPSFFPGLWFYFWEIPLVISLFLLGLKYSTVVATINGLFLFVFYAGMGFNNPVPHFISSLTTLVGVYVGQKIIKNSSSKTEKISTIKEVIVPTIFAVIFRVIVMLPVVFISFKLVFDFTAEEIIAVFPLLIPYDIIVVAYTVPVAYFIESRIKEKIKVEL
jgi:riboflavin transporter FmnP